MLCLLMLCNLFFLLLRAYIAWLICRGLISCFIYFLWCLLWSKHSAYKALCLLHKLHGAKFKTNKHKHKSKRKIMSMSTSCCRPLSPVMHRLFCGYCAESFFCLHVPAQHNLTDDRSCQVVTNNCACTVARVLVLCDMRWLQCTAHSSQLVQLVGSCCGEACHGYRTLSISAEKKTQVCLDCSRWRSNIIRTVNADMWCERTCKYINNFNWQVVQ